MEHFLVFFIDLKNNIENEFYKLYLSYLYNVAPMWG